MIESSRDKKRLQSGTKLIIRDFCQERLQEISMRELIWAEFTAISL